MDREEIERLHELEGMMDNENYTMTVDEYEEYYYLMGLTQDETESSFVREAQW